jgi:glycosyltransferase involved in cell wall biosynthesis
LHGTFAFPAVPPAVSVLIPVRNGESYLDFALRSLAGQTFGNFEIILIDNGSTDGTAAIIRHWQRSEPRVRAYSWPDLFLGECLRRGAELAAAPLLARLDADDVAHPERLARQVAAMEQWPGLAVLGTGADLIDGRGRKVGTIRNPIGHGALQAALRVRCPFIHSSIMMRTAAYRRAGGYRPGLHMSEDYDLWCRMAEAGQMSNLPNTLTSYRVHAASITSRQPVRMALTTICVAAAREARALGGAEPFVAGVPSLHAALAQLGLSRAAARRMIRIRVIRHRLSRHYLMLPLPRRLKSLIRDGAHRLGGRRLYLLLLNLLLGSRVQRLGEARGR